MTEESTLVLHRCTTFWTRFRGLHRLPNQTPGLYLAPCWAVHTVGMQFSIDVVFVDEKVDVLRVVQWLAPNRLVWCRGAKAVVELPAGYCEQHPDYLLRIRAALA